MPYPNEVIEDRYKEKVREQLKAENLSMFEDAFKRCALKALSNFTDTDCKSEDTAVKNAIERFKDAAVSNFKITLQLEDGQLTVTKEGSTDNAVIAPRDFDEMMTYLNLFLEETTFGRE